MIPLPDEMAQGPGDLFVPYQRGLCERLHSLLDALHPLLRADAVIALQERGKLLAALQPCSRCSSGPDGSWSLAVLLIAQHLSSTVNEQLVATVAVALECFICALDLLDDVEDEDQTSVVRSLGAPRALNVATALLALSQHAILSLPLAEASSSLPLRLLSLFQQALLTATTGQQKDLLAERRAALEVTEEECITVAAEKAGALLSLTCQLGALCAGADEEELRLFCELGELLGIAHQLDNDSHDLAHLLHNDPGPVDAVPSIKSDLVRQKKTLPIVLAARSQVALHSPSPDAEIQQPQRHCAALHEGIVAAWGIALLYKERARECLQLLEARRPVSAPLRHLLGFA